MTKMHIKGPDLSFLVWAHLMGDVMKDRIALYISIILCPWMFIKGYKKRIQR